MMKAMCGLYVLLLCSFACGGGDNDDAEAAERDLPDEQTLCALTIGVSSRQDVTETLGPPQTMLEDSRGVGFADYMSGVNSGNVSQLQGVHLTFDGDGILQDASVINMPFPSCWREQIDARERAQLGQ